MALMPERRARRHTGPADRNTPLRVGTPGQHVRAVSGYRYILRRAFAWPLDLLGRTGRARLRLRVRFGVTDDSVNVERWPARAGLDLWNGGIE